MRSADRFDLYKQRTSKIRKEELIRDKMVLAVSGKYIDALYYNEMFYSAVCWNTAAAVDRELKKINSKSHKLLYLKENIRTRMISLGWEDMITNWYKNGKAFTSEELESHLKMIVSKQRSRSIPTKPPVLISAQNDMP